MKTERRLDIDSTGVEITTSPWARAKAYKMRAGPLDIFHVQQAFLLAPRNSIVKHFSSQNKSLNHGLFPSQAGIYYYEYLRLEPVLFIL